MVNKDEYIPRSDSQPATGRAPSPSVVRCVDRMTCVDVEPSGTHRREPSSAAVKWRFPTRYRGRRRRPVKLKFHESSFPRSILVESSPGCHKDATTPMDRATLLNAKSTLSHCPPSLITRQRASVHKCIKFNAYSYKNMTSALQCHIQIKRIKTACP